MLYIVVNIKIMEFKDIKVGSFLKNLENKELHEVVANWFRLVI